MVQVLSLALGLYASTPSSPQDPNFRVYERLSEAPAELFAPWGLDHFMAQARDAGTRFFGLGPEDRFLFALDPEPSVSYYVPGQTVRLQWGGGYTVKFRLSDGALAHASLAGFRTYGVGNGYSEIEALQLAERLFREFAGVSLPKLSLRIVIPGDPKHRTPVGISVQQHPDGGIAVSETPAGSVYLSPDDLSLVSISKNEAVRIRPGPDLIGEEGARLAVQRVLHRYVPWNDVDLVPLVPHWQMPRGERAPFYATLTPTQEALGRQGVQVLARTVAVFDNSAYDPTTQSYWRWAVASVDCTEGNVMNFFEGWRITPRGPEGGLKAPESPPATGVRLVTEKRDREPEGGTIEPTGQASTYAPFGTWVGVLQGNRLRRGVVCEAGLLWV
ncbi:MAG: hypothetical protein IT207_01995, partial [Fimbriimonadaceae bacterium]|nr:hypothetical protein [Fimbriimonadaceae bacterium]